MNRNAEFLRKLASLMEEYGASIYTDRDVEKTIIELDDIEIFSGFLDNTGRAIKELRKAALNEITEDSPGINTQLNYSPKLRETMAKINTIIAQEDIAGYIVLHENGFSEYLLAIEPSWSIIKVKPPMVRLRSKLQEDFNGDTEAQYKATVATVNMLVHMLNNLKMHLEMFIHVYELLPESWQITSSNGVKTPYQPH